MMLVAGTTERVGAPGDCSLLLRQGSTARRRDDRYECRHEEVSEMAKKTKRDTDVKDKKKETKNER